MGIIKKIYARQIIDSRATPTIEVELWTNKSKAIASVPSGKSRGEHEAVELRDNNKKIYDGKSVYKAIKSVEQIKKKIIGKRVSSQEIIDNIMIKLDGTINKSRLGANAILAVSMAVAKAAAMDEEKPLYVYINELFGRKKKIAMPTPFANIINGGVHAGNNLAIQEFMIAPLKIRKFKEKIRAIVEIYNELKKLLEKRYGKSSINVGDEGGFAPNLKTNEEAIELILKAIKNKGYEKEVFIALDIAASELYRDNKYYLFDKELKMNGLTTLQVIDYYKELLKKYPIVSIEDGFSEDDFDSWRKLMKLSTSIDKAVKQKKAQIVGDDLLVSNPERIRKAVTQKLCNALLLKINQIGTISEAIEAARIAVINEWGVMVSHRSGETNDNFIAHLAVGLGTKQIKIGAPARGERVAKYNELLRISEEL